MNNFYLHSFLCLFFAVGLLIPTSVAAQPEGEVPVTEKSDEKRAADYYQKARQAYSEGRFERAAELLARAYDADPNLIYRYNEILARQGAGDYESALELLEEYRAEMLGDEDFDDIDEIRDELEEAVAGRQSPADDETVDEAPETTAPEKDSDILEWSLIGTGASAFGTGLVMSTGLLIGDTIDRLEDSRTDGVDTVYEGTSHDREADISRLRTHRWASAGLLIGGAALGATGGILLWSDRNSGPETEEYGRLQLQPMVDIDRAGAMLEGRF